jgi:outer membrane protein insertion porin family
LRVSKLIFVLAALLCLGVVSPAQQQTQVVGGIQIHGNRRIPAETIRARIFTREGDTYDPASLERDFNSLWNTNYFDDIRFEREESAKGWIIHVYVKERPTIRDIKYVGLSSVTQSDLLDKYKERKVGLTKESQFDPTRVKRAEVVLKEMLAARGRQFATVQAEIRPIPPAAVELTFVVKEGPKVKVGKISFEGVHKVSKRYVRNAMKNTKPIGIPHSLILENIFARTFDATKLNEDAERIRLAYQDKGYFKVIVQDPKTQIRDKRGINWFFPFKPRKGKVVDITVPIDEGERYKLKEIKFTGNKAITNTALLRSIFKIKDGDFFNRTLVGKGLEDLRKAYGEIGHINFTAVPDTHIDEEKKEIVLTIDCDEGKAYNVRRIEFAGNTTTRDKVIRRELALEEGQIYNSRLWEVSLLRLNQLQYFEPLDVEKDSTTKENNQEATVDITLTVKEKGKNSIGLTGGVSGLSGSFIGLNYETNNLLGRGETLSVAANVGSRERNIMFGFTEPYLFDRPIQLGFTVFTSKYNYDYVRELQIATGQEVNLPEGVLNSFQNYTQSRTGFTVSASYPLKRSFNRVGLTYSLDSSSLSAFSDASRLLFETINFRSISGPSALQGIVTSKFVPSFSRNTIDNPLHPKRGTSFFVGGEVAGIGGNVQMVRPITEFKHWFPMQKGRNSIGFRVQGSFVTGYAGNVAPPFERFYQGGENDLRGFDIRSISPMAFLPQRVDLPLTAPDDPCLSGLSSACVGIPKDPNNPRQGIITIPLAIRQLVFPGGDTSIVSNLEYRIPIAGPVTLAPFMDVGWNFVTRESQLRVSNQALETLNTTLFGCVGIDPVTLNCLGGQTQTFQRQLQIIDGTNFVTRMSTGLELQVIMPVVNAPLRIYYAFNPLRLNNQITTPTSITRDLFPPGAAGDVTFQRALSSYGLDYRLREPSKTFRFTVATTF